MWACRQWGLLPSCSAQASPCCGFSCCRAQALGTGASVAAVHRLSSRSLQALLPRGMGDLPSQGSNSSLSPILGPHRCHHLFTSLPTSAPTPSQLLLISFKATSSGSVSWPPGAPKLGQVSKLYTFLAEEHRYQWQYRAPNLWCGPPRPGTRPLLISSRCPLQLDQGLLTARSVGIVLILSVSWDSSWCPQLLVEWMNEWITDQSLISGPCYPILSKLDSEDYFHNLRSTWNSMNMGGEKLVLTEGSFPWSLTLCSAFLHSLLLGVNFVFILNIEQDPKSVTPIPYWTKSSVITASKICHTNNPF